MGRRAYTQEFKDQAAAMVIRDGRSFKEIAQNLGVDQSSLRHWVRLARAAGVRADPAVAAAKDPAQRIKELEAEVRRLQMERDILKKAAAYFARESTEERP